MSDHSTITERDDFILEKWAARFCANDAAAKRLADDTRLTVYSSPNEQSSLIDMFSTMRGIFIEQYVLPVGSLNNQLSDSTDLRGRTYLVVEDDYHIATDIARALEAEGAEVEGPIPSIEDAMRLSTRSKIDGAVLDIRLGSDNVFPLADHLAALKVPFLFVTGYDRSIAPERHRLVPFVSKPFDAGDIVGVLKTIAAVDLPS